MWVSLCCSVNPEREPADEVGVGDDHAFRPAWRDLEVGLDRVGAPKDPRDHTPLHVLNITG